MSALLPPEEWSGKLVSTLDVLLLVRERLLEGFSIEVIIGRTDVHAFESFQDGMHFHQFFCGGDDRSLIEFWAWLRDEKGEFPSPGGWARKYLEEFAGDHKAAIMKFLDRCAEFAASRRPQQPSKP